MPTPATHLWRPSAARSITLDAFVPVPRGTTASAPAPLSWPLKDPGDTLDYQFNIAPALLGDDGDAITTLDVSITPANTGDLALSSVAADGVRAVLWLTAGITGTTYTVTLAIGMQSGRILSRSVLLPVVSLAMPSATPQVLTTAGGTPLTDGNGNPVVVPS